MQSLRNYTVIIIYITLLVSCASNRLNINEDIGYSELALAIKSDDFNKIKSLVSLGADIHNVTTKRAYDGLATQEPAIVLAVSQFMNGATEKRKLIVKYFLERGARTNNLNLTDRNLNYFDKSGALSKIIAPYKNSTSTIVSNKQRKEIAKLSKQTNNKNAVSNTIPVKNHDIVDLPKHKRIALVIGNSKYVYGALKNPKNDAADIALVLKSLNFEVELKVNANQEEMETAIDRFSNKLSQNSVGLFYYAGHGVQVNGENYLIPIGAKINKQADVRYKAVNMGQILDGMGQARNGLNVAIIDACRDNPLPRSYRSSGHRGLARVSSPDGTLLAFATAPGNTASDGGGRNGLYTNYLLKHIKTKNISIERMLKLVSRDVKQASGNKQTPWMESSFTGDFFF